VETRMLETPRMLKKKWLQSIFLKQNKKLFFVTTINHYAKKCAFFGLRLRFISAIYSGAVKSIDIA
jgi:hypothetical protein